jgi:hypothetical protein
MHAVLSDAAAAFPDELAPAELAENARMFRDDYTEALPRFEAARLASTQRQLIARHLAAAIQRRMVWQDAGGQCSLDDALEGPATPLPLEAREMPGEPGWRPSPVYRGVRWDPHQLADLGAELVSRGVVTHAAGNALAWVAGNVLENGRLRLTGRKIAVLGAGAEMAPTRFWLEAGADVLWLDMVPPPKNWLDDERLAGRLYWPRENVDLLTRPQEVLATIISFSAGDPVDLGLYAYAPGHARELRLTGVMNAIVNALPTEYVASVTVLVSPTTPAALDQPGRAAMRARREERPLWEAGLAHLGLLGRGEGSVTVGKAAATRTVVSIQGASYQASQYLGKVLIAECWATYGPPAADEPSPLRVSANTAAITRTRSLDHPVFAAAFGGAGAFGVETFTPRLSRRLNGLLALHDWLHPELPEPGMIRVHGGIHCLPYPLEPTLRVAAAFGFARSPRLLRSLVRR